MTTDPPSQRLRRQPPLHLLAPAAAPAGAHLWSRHIPTGAPIHEAHHTAAADAAGNVSLAFRAPELLDLGTVDGPVFRGRQGEVVVLSLDPHGTLRWGHRFAGEPDRAPWSVALDHEGNTLVAGKTPTSAFLTKFDPSGRHSWTRMLSSHVLAAAQDGEPIGLAIDGEGHAHVVFTSGTSTGSFAALAVYRIDPKGVPVWFQRYAGSVGAPRPRIAVDSAGNVVLSGYFRGTLSVGPNVFRKKTAADVYVVKLDAGGKHLWSTQMDGRDVVGLGTGVDAGGNIVLAGAFYDALNVSPTPVAGDCAVFLTALEPRGRAGWTKVYSADAKSRIEPSCIVGSRGILLGGSFEGALTFGAERFASAPENEGIFVADFDAAGDPRWSRGFKGPRDRGAISVHHAPAGGAFLAGAFGGELDFGGTRLRTEGAGLDLFVTRLAGAGVAAPAPGAA